MSSSGSRGTSAAFAPLAVWLSLQLLALAVAALRVPLSAMDLRTPERLAADIMIVTQIAGAAMLFPFLFGGLRTSVLVIASSWPMLQLAGFLAGTPAPLLLRAGLYITAWLITLACLAYVFQSEKSQLIAGAITATVTWGGPVLWYVRAEFVRHDASVQWAIDGALGPLMGALAQLHEPAVALLPWGLMAALLAFSIAAVLYCRRRRHRPDSQVGQSGDSAGVN